MRRRALILLVAVLGLLVAYFAWSGPRASKEPAFAPPHADAAASGAREDALVRADSPDARAPIPEPAAPTSKEEPREVAPAIPIVDDLHFCARLVAREDQQPIAGARVHVEARAAAMPENAVLNFATDADGRFEVDLATARSPYLAIHASGFGPALVMPQVGHETPAKAIVLLLDRAATLNVHLLGPGGIPVAGARIRASTGFEHLLRPDGAELLSTVGIADPVWNAETDAQGACTIAALPPDAPLHLEATREGKTLRKETEPVTLRAGEERTIRWTIGAGSRLSGRVTEISGAAVAGLDLWLLRAESDHPVLLSSSADSSVVKRKRSGAGGEYAIEDVAAGKWWIGPAPSRAYRDGPSQDAIAPLAVMVEIPEGAAEVRQDLVVRRGLYIRGRVVDASGAPAARAAVFGASEDHEGHESVGADDEGAFAFGPLVPGRYRLKAIGGADQVWSDPVIASAGDEGVVLTVALGATLSGMVVDAISGAPCPARLTVTSDSVAEPLRMLAETMPDGTFSLQGMQPGTYDLAAHTDDARVGIVRGLVIAHNTRHSGPVLRVSAGARVRMRYDGKSRYGTFEVLSDGAIVGIDTLENGTTSSQPVPAGRCVVRFTLWDPTRTQEKVMQLAVGEEKSCAFTDTP
jgi:hypothetical protein